MRAFGILPSKIKSWEPNKIKNETSCTAPIFVEFGAGRGKLSLALCTVLSQAAHIILVEREGGISKKADSKIRELGRTCQRLRIDIADLDLAAIQILQSTSANQHECLKLPQKITTSPSCMHMTGISKHLCGPATDLALRCVCNFVYHVNNNINRNSSHEQSLSLKVVDGIAFALCCHHRLTWDEYCGKAFFKHLGQYFK